MKALQKNMNCPACGNHAGNKFFTGSERMFGNGGEFPYCECSKCKAVFIMEVPVNLGSHYSGDYYSFHEYKKSSTIGKFLKKVRYRAFKLGISIKPPVYFDWISKLNAKENSRIADIGCGNGQLLAELQYCGFGSLYGYDPFLASSEQYPGFSLLKTDYFNISERYDVVMFHHSFEHISDPVGVFKKFDEILNPGGSVLIRTPITDGQVWKEEREFWFQLDAPRHLFIPSIEAIQTLANRFGMELYLVEFDSLDNQFWGTELYKRGKPFVGTDLNKEFTKEELSGFKDKAAVFNFQKMGDQASFYLRKK